MPEYALNTTSYNVRLSYTQAGKRDSQQPEPIRALLIIMVSQQCENA